MPQVTITLDQQDAEDLAEYLDLNNEYDNVVKLLLDAVPWKVGTEDPSWMSKYDVAGKSLAQYLSTATDRFKKDWWAIRSTGRGCTVATKEYWQEQTHSSDGVEFFYLPIENRIANSPAEM